MFDWVRHAWVWAAIAASVAVLGFLFTHIFGRKRFHFWRLQRVIDAEQSFYAKIAAPRRGDSGLLIERMTRQYVASVDLGLMGMA